MVELGEWRVIALVLPELPGAKAKRLTVAIHDGFRQRVADL